MTSLFLKKAGLFGFTLVLSSSLLAQTNHNCYYFNKNNIVEKTVYNEKNEIIAKQEYKVLDISPSSNKLMVTGQTIQIKDGKETDKNINTFICDNSTLLISMGKSDKGEEVYLDYPEKPDKVYKLISEIQFNTDTKFAGKKLKAKCEIENRKILSENVKVKSSGGSWDCIKIAHDMKVGCKVIGINISVKLHIIEYFSPGTGIVKTEIFRGNKLEQCRIVTNLNSIPQI